MEAEAIGERGGQRLDRVIQRDAAEAVDDVVDDLAWRAVARQDVRNREHQGVVALGPRPRCVAAGLGGRPRINRVAGGGDADAALPVVLGLDDDGVVTEGSTDLADRVRRGRGVECPEPHRLGLLPGSAVRSAPAS
jgi:hypothetical protein